MSAAPQDRVAAQERFLLRLYFDRELRESFINDRARALEDADLDDQGRSFFRAVDAVGLEADATLRRDYLMSSLCRAYPLSAAAIGSAPRGPRMLESFLTSILERPDPAQRSRAFGRHLARLLELGALELSREVELLVGAVLEMETARATCAAELRSARDRPGRPRKPTSSLKKRGRVVLPPFFVVVELPLPVEVISSALDHVGPADAWARIRAGSLQHERLVTAARALAIPVTVLCRAYTTSGSGSEASAKLGSSGEGGPHLPVEVAFSVAELTGAHGAFFGQIDGTRRLDQLGAAEARLVRPLVDKGLLELAA